MSDYMYNAHLLRWVGIHMSLSKQFEMFTALEYFVQVLDFLGSKVDGR